MTFFWVNFANVRFPDAKLTFAPETLKSQKSEKVDKKSKKSSKSDIAPFGPQSGTKQSIWRGYETGLYEVILIWSQKMIQKDAFDLQKMMRKPLEF